MTTALQQLRKELQQEEARLAKLPAMQRISKLKSAISALVGTANSAPRPKRHISEETRKKLAAAGRKGAKLAAQKAKAAESKGAS